MATDEEVLIDGRSYDKAEIKRFLLMYVLKFGYGYVLKSEVVEFKNTVFLGEAFSKFSSLVRRSVNAGIFNADYGDRIKLSEQGKRFLELNNDDI